MHTSPRRLAAALISSSAVMAGGVGAVELSTGGGPSDTPPTRTAPPGQDGTPAALTIIDFAFAPTTAKVVRGSPIEIKNMDAAKHTVTSGTRDEPGKDFDVDVDGNSSGELVIEAPGTYEYICRIHPGMKGSIEVVP